MMPNNDLIHLEDVARILTDPAYPYEPQIERAILRIPTVDAVEVVHCRDCKYAHMTYDGEVKYCDKISMPDDEGDYGYALYLPGDFYCACGERKTDA